MSAGRGPADDRGCDGGFAALVLLAIVAALAFALGFWFRSALL